MTFLFLTLSRFSIFPAYKRAIGMGEALAALGHGVFVLAEDCEENRKRLDSEAPHCKAVFYKRGLWPEIRVKISAVWRIRPDVVYSLSYSLRNLAGLSLFFPRRAKYVLEYCELYSSWKRFWVVREALSLFEISGMVCASRYLEKVFARRLKMVRRRVPILYQPYAYPIYLRGDGASVPRKRKCVLFMATLWRGYGVYDVLKAFVGVLEKFDGDVDLEVLGSGPEKENVIKWVKDRLLEDRIHIRGYVDEGELNDYFSRADVFVAPMRDTVQDWARCPSKVFYYIPYNKPIVTCRIGDPHDILGSSGYYYDHDNVESMAAVMLRALRESDSFTFPRGFIEQHSWGSRAEEFASWIKSW